MSARIRPLIFLFDPHNLFAGGVAPILSRAGHDVECFQNEEKLIGQTGSNEPNLVLKSRADGGRRGKGGLLERILSASPDTQVLFVADETNVRVAMDAIHRGAFDCIAWPCEPGQLLDAVRRAAEFQSLAAESPKIRERLAGETRPDILRGRSKSMREVRGLVQRVAGTDATILIEGESGTGKELVARALHESGRRSAGPFIAVNCAALTDTIIESELFGHVRGAFTGALADKPGRFELADGGTLLLDEIADLSPKGQADLLRVLEDGIFRPVGSRSTRRADVRVIAATNKPLGDLCARGDFREDLFYRLNVVTISLPPLRSRPEDISGLALEFCRHFCARHRRPQKRISEALEGVLAELPWPGNVRQLRNIIEHMVLVIPERILLPGHLPAHLSRPVPRGTGHGAFPPGMPLEDAMDLHVARTLEFCGGNRTRAAAVLKISRRALVYRLARMKSKHPAELR